MSEPEILFEDSDLLVVNKPGHLVCHSASRPGQSSLADWVRQHGVATPRFVHRLDRETSGVVLVAKNERAARLLGKQILRRQIQREYLAICWGRFDQARGVVDKPIGLTRDDPVYTKRVVDEIGGKPALTEFEVQQELAEFTLVRLRPRTGRAHQLRVHMAWLGHPIVGDKVYGPDQRWYLEFIRHGVTEEMLRELLLPRHALHAMSVSARHPGTQQPMTWQAELPEDMRRFLQKHA